MLPWTSSPSFAIPEMRPWSPVLVGFPGFGKDMHRCCVGLGDGQKKTKGRSSHVKVKLVRYWPFHLFHLSLYDIINKKERCPCRECNNGHQEGVETGITSLEDILHE